MLNARMDRSPVGRLSGWLVALALVALTVPIAGLTLSAAGSARPAAVVSPTAAAPQVPDTNSPPAPAAARQPITTPAPAPVAARVVERTRAADNPPQALGPAKLVVSVTDQLGRSVPNASVVVTSAGLLVQIAEGKTDQSGAFTSPSLTDGHFQLAVFKPGFKTIRINVTLEPGKTTTSRVVLQLGMLAETIVVSAKPGVAPSPVGAAQPGVATPTGTIAPQARRIGTAPTEDPCSQSTEGGCITPPRKLVDAKPVYPAWAIESGTSGTVVIQGRVRTDGSVGDMQPAPDANPDFVNAAMQAIRLWEFSPTRLNGVPVEVQVEVTVMFVAGKK